VEKLSCGMVDLVFFINKMEFYILLAADYPLPVYAVMADPARR
jgi:hypothetical protein